MALVDLANLDFLDAVLGHRLPEDVREKLLNNFIEAYTNLLGLSLNHDLKPEDDEVMKELVASPDLTPEKLDQFYKDRIPHFEAKVYLLALEFKKKFLLDVYKNKVEEYESSENKQGYEAWQQIYADAQADNWNEVARLLKVVDEMPVQPAPPPPVPQSPPPATV